MVSEQVYRFSMDGISSFRMGNRVVQVECIEDTSQAVSRARSLPMNTQLGGRA